MSATSPRNHITRKGDKIMTLKQLTERQRRKRQPTRRAKLAKTIHELMAEHKAMMQRIEDFWSVKS